LVHGESRGVGMHTKLSASVLLVTVIGIASSLLGCGDDGGGSTMPSPSPIVVSEGAFPIGTVLTALTTGDVCNFLQFIPFSTGSTGTIEAVVDWSSPANDIDPAIVRGQCTCTQVQQAPSVDQLNRVCPTVAESSSVTAKPERIVASNQPAGSYTLIVVNFGDTRESFSYQVIHTPGI